MRRLVLPVVLLVAMLLMAANTNQRNVFPRSVVADAAYTRPADVLAYAAGDQLANSTSAPVRLTFSACAAVPGGSGRITGARVVDDAAAATKATLELWIFDTTPTPNNDNAAYAPSDADMLNLVGVVALGATPIVGNAGVGAAGNCVFEKRDISIPFVCGPTVSALYGLVVVRNAYTPVSAEVFTVRLEVTQD